MAEPNSYSKPIVIKVGGTLLADDDAMDAFWPAVRQLRETAPVVIVHGGGKQATALADRLGHTPQIVQGRRVTTDLDLKIMQWALRGALNTELVATARRQDLLAVGLSGADGDTLRVNKRPPWQIDGEEVDFGWVGDVDRVDPTLLNRLLTGGFLPIVAPLGIDAEGHLYNVNADTVARALADALQAAQFLLVTDAGGVRHHPDEPNSLLRQCDADTFASGKEEGWIQGGMRVKLTVAFDALQANVPEVFILAPDDLITRARATQVVP